MYLQRLEIQGYKSFARKTEFIFDRGITAIVGPNGSGKSNVADALRWVLGETRISLLRARVTDELIFAGSDSRARLGMAHATMTLDNSDGVLPIDYTEVTIERRAYRDGQNEHLLNGIQVRLRDVVELLGAGGISRDGYTIIGQGLVDRVLFLSPQERRGLIDVAAGIQPLQDKRDRALRQLEETYDNLIRVRDIAAELEPRLRRLEKQAERARQSAQMAEELADLLKIWYGYQWHEGQQALRDARARAEGTQQALTLRRQTVTTLEQRIKSRRDREEAQLDQLNELREQHAGLRSRFETVHRDLAVGQERMTFLQRRQQELAQEIADLQAQRDEQLRQLTDTETTLTRLIETCDEWERRVEAIQHQQAGTQQKIVEYQSALESARRETLDTEVALGEIHNRLATLAERREELARERTSQQDTVIHLVAQVDNHRIALNDARQQARSHEHALQQLQRDREQFQTSLDQAVARLTAMSEQVAGARRELERHQARYDALAETRLAGNDEATGTQAVLNAGDALRGIIGTVAALIEVPADYETAIEAALGPHLHAIVVETWANAQHAIAWLEANRAGRATFIPLETFQDAELPAQSRRAKFAGCLFGWLAGRRAEEQTSRGTEVQGWVGRASDLVGCEPPYKPLLEHLLGQTIIVENLEIVEQPASLRSAWVPSGSSVYVTLEGTVVGPFGRVSGGTIRGDVLSRERSLRELLAQIQVAEAEVGRLEREQSAAQAAADSLTRRLAEIDSQAQQTKTAQSDAQAAIDKAQRDIEALEREIDWRNRVVDEQNEEAQAMENRIVELQGRLDDTHTRHANAQSCLESLQVQLRELKPEALRDELAEAEKQLALARQDRRNQEGRQHDLRTVLAGTGSQIDRKQDQMEALSAETEALQARIEALAREEHQLSHELSALQAAITPAEEELQNMRHEGRDLEREANLARDHLRQAEAAVSEANLNVQRCEDRLARLRDKIADDLELAASGEELPQQLTLMMEGDTQVLPAVLRMPEGLEQRVQQLRRQIRQLGAASPEIIAEYEETKERYDFLTSQAADLEEAVADLRGMAAELAEVMAERFMTTFEEVAQAFEKYFNQLFGGGEAHVSLTTDEEGEEPGLDIVARPPGKRLQRLALLSGGERSLTAIALLFALLQVSPTPFCILDEVDAMLDEANVGRFRAVLEDLAQKTQFIVITHNRTTVEAADTIYGISMGDEGVSQAISLKLDELEPVPV